MSNWPWIYNALTFHPPLLLQAVYEEIESPSSPAVVFRIPMNGSEDEAQLLSRLLSVTKARRNKLAKSKSFSSTTTRESKREIRANRGGGGKDGAGDGDATAVAATSGDDTLSPLPPPREECAIIKQI
jgi:hypothetical protein